MPGFEEALADEFAAIEAGNKEHELKVWPEFFDALLDGTKPFDVREVRDRDFAIGDVLELREWDPGRCRDAGSIVDGVDMRYTGRTLRSRVTYVLDLADVCGRAVAPGYVVLGLERARL